MRRSWSTHQHYIPRIYTSSLKRSFHNTNRWRFTSCFLKHDYQIFGRLQPRSRDMVPTQSKQKHNPEGWWKVFHIFCTKICFIDIGKWLRLPSLGWYSTASLKLDGAISTSIVAGVTATFTMNCPVSSYALTIYPYLTLSHALHVNSQRLTSLRGSKISLQVYSG